MQIKQLDKYFNNDKEELYNLYITKHIAQYPQPIILTKLIYFHQIVTNLQIN
jgi:hypothetical protein